jgi:riboflavin kinase/FMN adenylyltransferase
VYACLVDRLGAAGPSALAKGVANVGVRPTVDAGFGVEVHLFDFEGDLYGAELRVHIVTRIRDERRFRDLGELREQIELDLVEARAVLAGSAPGPHGAWF